MFVASVEDSVNDYVLEFVSSRRRKKMLIDGKFVDAESGETFPIYNPASGMEIAQIPAAAESDVNKAVAAARRAFDDGPWPRMLPADRQNLLLKLADLIEARGEEIAQMETLNQGKLIDVARAVEVNMGVDYVRYMAGWATKIEGSTMDLSLREPEGMRFHAFTRREPVGVVAGITPWNYPHLMALWKVIPALTCGCTTILKPAEETPLTALHLAELVTEAGFPDGVVNVITGDGETCGAPLTRHRGVDKIAFTGSTEVGKLIGHEAIENMTRVSLELGGKSPVMVLDDIEPEFMAPNAMMAIFFNHGQACIAGSRLYLPKTRFDEMLERIVDLTDFFRLGSGFDDTVHMGPMVSRSHQERVLGLIDAGKKEGGSVVYGGEALAGASGFFVKPTIFTDVTHDMRIVKEEVFGPVLCAMPYDDIDDLVQKANDHQYGLAAGIFSNNISRVMDLIPRIRAGTIWVNSYSIFDPNLPFGGFKMSGIGKEHGSAAIDLFTESKSVCIAY
jgi:phenylacetaldehyde dehydrogenase